MNGSSPTVARHVLGPRGERLGSVLAYVSAPYLVDALRAIGREPGMHYALYRGDGRILFRQAAGAPVHFDVALPPRHPLHEFLGQKRTHEVGLTRHGVTQGLRVYAMQRLSEMPLVIVVGSSATRLVARAGRSWAVGVCGVVAATFLLWAGFVVALHSIARADRSRALLREALTRSRAGERAKAAFLGNLSHELRTPLTGILGYASFIERLSSEERVRDMGATVRRSAERLTGLLNDSLDAARIEAGAMSVVIADADVHALVGEAASLFEPAARAMGLHLAARIAQDVPPTVRCDPARLGQVLHNLLSNALKFTDRGEIHLEAMYADGQIVFVVEDTGCGIESDALGHIFERFRQANERVAWHHGGTGLGLALARDFMRRMGGDITVASMPGRGTTMTVTLPA